MQSETLTREFLAPTISEATPAWGLGVVIGVCIGGLGLFLCTAFSKVEYTSQETNKFCFGPAYLEPIR